MLAVVKQYPVTLIKAAIHNVWSFKGEEGELTLLYGWGQTGCSSAEGSVAARHVGPTVMVLQDTFSSQLAPSHYLGAVVGRTHSAIMYVPFQTDCVKCTST